MEMRVTLRPGVARFVEQMVRMGEASSAEAYVNALIEERIASFDPWFRRQLAEAAAAGVGGSAGDEAGGPKPSRLT